MQCNTAELLLLHVLSVLLRQRPRLVFLSGSVSCCIQWYYSEYWLRFYLHCDMTCAECPADSCWSTTMCDMLPTTCTALPPGMKPLPPAVKCSPRSGSAGDNC